MHCTHNTFRSKHTSSVLHCQNYVQVEGTARSRNEIAAMRERVATLRREVNRLDVKMKEDLGNLDNEI
ncbi:hypothetical protein J3A83DRAFT_4202293 [Scleroderma citrinum]